MNSILRSCAVLICCLLTFPMLVREGMFMDAMLYTSVAHNLADGWGTFWFPVFSKHNLLHLDSFHEQPPLGIFIESIFFRLFGDSLYVERFYTACTLLINAFLIHATWRSLHFKQKESGQSWLPLLFWISIPVVFWSFAQPMLENTMGIFVLLSFLAILKAARSENHASWSLLAGILVVMAFMVKGLPGIFTLAVPLLMKITLQNISWRKAVVMTALMTGVVMLSALAMYLYEPARQSLSHYIFDRLLYRVEHDATVSSRWFTPWRLFQELIPALVLTTIAFFAVRKERRRLDSESKKRFLFLLLTGLAGTLPLMLTPVQKGFYMVAALPFFALALSIPVSRWIGDTSEWRVGIGWQRFFKFLPIVLFLILFVAVATSIGKTKRDEDVLHDVRLAATVIPAGSVIGVNNTTWNHWHLQTYLMRYYQISMEQERGNDWMISIKGEKAPEGYLPVEIDLDVYALFKRNPERVTEQ